MSDKRNKVPPDGGYGWIVVAAKSFSKVIMAPYISCFALIFKDKFIELGIPVTDLAFIVILYSALSMSLGLINGPLLKIFGYRKMAVAGGLIFAVGVMMTGPATTFVHFIVTHSIITAAGMSFSFAAWYLAINTYFEKKRSRASGIALTVIGFGPIILPQLIPYLLAAYGETGTMLIFGGVALNCAVAGCLLHPIKWHMKKVDILGSEEVGLEKQLKSEERNSDRAAYSEMITEPWKKSSETVNLGSCMQIFTDNNSDLSVPTTDNERTCCGNLAARSLKENVKIILNKIAEIFDLHLLKNPTFLVTTFALSVDISAEINFSVLFPLIVGDMGYSIREIALIMSTIAFVDLIFRFISPFVGDFFSQKYTAMYIYAILIAIIGKIVMLGTRNFKQTLAVSVIIGIAKGIRTVHLGLVLPSVICLEKLPTANGLLNISNGIFLLVIGRIVGLIRDNTGNYCFSVLFIGFLSLSTVCLLIFQIFYTKKIEIESHKDDENAESKTLS